MTEFDKFRLYALRRFVFFRWLFAFVGIVTIILVSVAWGQQINLNFSIFHLLAFFVALILINFLPYFVIDVISKRASSRRVFILACGSLFFDFVMVLVLVYLLGGPGLLSGFFLFWPIISSVVLFSFWAPFFTALISGVSIFAFGFLERMDILHYLSSGTESFFVETEGDILFLAAYAVLYIVTAIVFAFNYHLVKPVKIFQAHRPLTEPIEIGDEKKAQDQWIAKMNEKLEQANRQLHSKELELKLAKQQLEKLEQAKSKFISVTTHQLRTPLSAIKWTFNMMLSGQLGQVTDDQQTFLSKGYESTQRMISIVNNLLNLDHIGTDQSELSTAMVKLPELIEKVAFEFENQLESKQISLIIKKPDREMPEVEIDPSQIRMVLENLIDNAIKYTKKEGQVTIKIKDDRINSVNPSMEIVVEDSGIGIPEEEQKKIFHKFFRASNAVSVEPDGTGIGLFIAKDIIERHGGTMWFESVAQKGTSFHLTLPLRQEKLKVDSENTQ